MPSGRLVLISGKDPLAHTGGHASYVQAHALAAARLGFEPHIVAASPRGEITPTPYGIVHRIAAPPSGHLPVAFQIPLLARAARHVLDGHDGLHIIHGFAIWSASAVLAARSLARRGQCATAIASAYATRVYEIAAMQDGLGAHVSPRSRLWYRAWLKWASLVDDRIEGWGYRNARVVGVNYRSVERILTRAYGNQIAVRLMPYAAPASFDDAGGEMEPRPEIARPSRSAEAPLIVTLSRHDPRKGIDVLLHALAGLAAARVPFRALLIGPGQLLGAHRRLAADLGLADVVSIPGAVPDVEPYLRPADIFALPSRAEASGSVAVLEALRRGIPVVASACDGIPEDITDERAGVLVPPGDADALRDALAGLIRDRSRRLALGAAGRRLHLQRFSAARLTEALGELYTELGIAALAA